MSDTIFFDNLKFTKMEKFAILARVEAKPGKEKEVLEFLKSALPLAESEQQTVRWYALQLGLPRLVFSIRSKRKTEEMYI